MYQPLIKFHPHPAIFTQVLTIFVKTNTQYKQNHEGNIFIFDTFIRHLLQPCK